MITKNSKATFVFKNNFVDQDEALDWLYRYIETGLPIPLDLDLIENLDGSKIVIERRVFDCYYDITFTNLYDIDGITQLKFYCICESHFKDIIKPKQS
jgi:hypothetical protein